MFADFLQLLLFPLMLNVNERMGIDMLGSGQLGAVSVCVYGGAVLLADNHSPPAQGWWTLLVGKHNTGQGIGWNTTASWGELHS